MGTGLSSHPKVKTLRRALKADVLRVVGGLWAVWCVFDEHSASGRLDGYTLADMDEEIGWKGFASALRDIGWLIEDADGLEAPDYEEHNGPNAKRRALDASRKGKTRAEKTEEAPHVPPDVRIEAGQMSASDADNLRNREEKRREEKKEEPDTHAVTDAGRVCRLLKAQGVVDVNPGHPDLRMLLDAGATDAEFIGAATSAAAKGKGFAYTLGTLKRQRQEAANTAGTLRKGAIPNKQESIELRNSVVGDAWVEKMQRVMNEGN